MKKHTEELHPLFKIGRVTVYANNKCSYIRFKSNLDICNDGSGPSHGDPYYQSETAYYNGGKFLNADRDFYIVIPPQIRKAISPVVMGCQARLTNTKTKVNHDAVTGDIGPKNKTGEASYVLAKFVNPEVTHNSGDSHLIYLYELWPGVPAVVGRKEYALEPA